MNSSHRAVLQEHHEDLAQDILVTDDFLSNCYQKKLFSSQFIDIIKAESTSQSRVCKLLEILPKRGPDAFTKFVSILRPEYPWLAEKLANLAEQKIKADLVSEVKATAGSKIDGGLNASKHLPEMILTRDKNDETKATESINDGKENEKQTKEKFTATMLVCKICNQWEFFKDFQSMTKHILIVHSDSEIKCRSCKKAFTKFNLKECLCKIPKHPIKIKDSAALTGYKTGEQLRKTIAECMDNILSLKVEVNVTENNQFNSFEYTLLGERRNKSPNSFFTPQLFPGKSGTDGSSTPFAQSSYLEDWLNSLPIVDSKDSNLPHHGTHNWTRKRSNSVSSSKSCSRSSLSSDKDGIPPRKKSKPDIDEDLSSVSDTPLSEILSPPKIYFPDITSHSNVWKKPFPLYHLKAPQEKLTGVAQIAHRRLMEAKFESKRCVILNISGTKFQCSTTELGRIKDSLFYFLVQPNSPYQPSFEDGVPTFFFCRSSRFFHLIVNYIHNGLIAIKPTLPTNLSDLHELKNECEFYLLNELQNEINNMIEEMEN